MTELVLKGFSGLRRNKDKAVSVWTFILLIPLVVAVFDSGQFYSIIFIALNALASTLPYMH